MIFVLQTVTLAKIDSYFKEFQKVFLKFVLARFRSYSYLILQQLSFGFQVDKSCCFLSRAQ